MAGPYYWVNGSGNTSDATNHWATVSGGAPNVANVPTSTDDVHWDALSNLTAYTVTVDATFSCRDLKFDAAPAVSGTVTLAGSAALNVYGSFLLLAGMTVSYTGNVAFVAASGTKTITSNGVVSWTNGGTITFNGAGTTFQLADALSVNPSNFYLAAGTFDPNGKGVTLSRFLGGTITGSPTFYNLTLSGGATVSNIYVLTGNPTVTNLLTITGAAANRHMLVQSNTLGTARTITAAAVALTNCDFMDIVGAGAAAPFTGTSLGDCLGNSGITFTTAADQYWYTATTGTKTWSTAGNWFLGSGGTGGAGRVPLPQDNVIFDANSIGAANTTIVADMPRLGKDITWTGVTNSPSWVISAIGVAVFGSLTTTSSIGMTIGNSLLLSGRSSHTLNWGGLTPASTGITYIHGPGGTYTLASAMTLTGHLSLYYGAFADAGYSVTVSSFASNHTLVRTINATGSWTITGSGSCWNLTTTTNLTVTALPSQVKFTDATQTAKVFAGGSKTYGNIWFASPTTFKITGSNTFTDFKADPGAIIQSTAGTTQTAATWSVNGQAATGSDAPCVFMDGVSGTYFSAPDSVLNSNSPDKIEAKLALTDWTPALGNLVAAKRSGAGQITAAFFVNAGGPLSLFASFDGTASSVSVSSTANLSFTDGGIGYVKYERNESTGVIKFYTSTDGSAWVQLGIDVAAAAGALYDSTSPWEIGSQLGGTNSILNGKIFWVRGYSASIPIFNFDPSLWATGNTFTASTGEVWTRNGNAQFTGTNLVTLMGLTNAGYTLAKSGGGTVAADYISVRNCTASPADTFYGYHAYDGGSNVNWIWAAALGAVGAEATATGAAGTLGVDMTVPASGAEATGGIGTLAVDMTVPITGAEATGGISITVPTTVLSISGFAGTSGFGEVGIGIGLTGVLATAAAGRVSIPVNGIMLRSKPTPRFIRAGQKKVFLRAKPQFIN